MFIWSFAASCCSQLAVTKKAEASQPGQWQHSVTAVTQGAPSLSYWVTSAVLCEAVLGVGSGH